MVRLAEIGLLVVGVLAHAEATSCTEIAAVPFTIKEPGAYCLKKSLTFAGGHRTIAVGSTDVPIDFGGTAILVGANDVVIDFRGHALDGTPAGPLSDAVGVRAHGRRNVTLRNGTIRGFHEGISLGGTSYVVEDLRLQRF